MSPSPDRWRVAAGLRGNRPMLRFGGAYLGGIVAEWGLFVAALVYAYANGGSTAAGVAAIVLLLPNVAFAPLAGLTADRWPPSRVCTVAYASEALAFGAAAVGAAAGAPTAVVIGLCAVGAAAFTFVRPAAAVLTPALARSSRELTSANLLVSYCESAAVLGGPLFATVLLAAGGPALALIGCAAASGIAALVSLRNARSGPPATGSHTHGARQATAVFGCLVRLCRRRGTAGVLAAVFGRDVLVGALDLLAVVFAVQLLGLGDAGAGVLGTAVGVGALVSVFCAAALIRWARLATIVMAALGAVAVAMAGFGGIATLAAALVLLPIVGFSQSLLDLTTRMLLQRSVAPRELGSVFAVLELLAGVGALVGTLFVQVLIAAWSPQVAAVGVGAYFVVVLALSAGRLRTADAEADVPVVAISLLRQHPLFAPLSPLALEAVARAAVEVRVADGDVVVAEGDLGDRFYVVADGAFDVVMGGEHIRSATRGGGFGEVALLADVPRTATVSAVGPGTLLEIERAPFLVAVTGTDSSHLAAWSGIRAMRFDVEVPDYGPASA